MGKKISLRDSKVTYSQPKQWHRPELFTNSYPNLGSLSKKKKRRHYLRKKIKESQENQNGHFFHHWICKQLTLKINLKNFKYTHISIGPNLLQMYTSRLHRSRILSTKNINFQKFVVGKKKLLQIAIFLKYPNTTMCQTTP